MRQVDTLFINGPVLTQGPAGLLDPGLLAVRGGRIVTVAPYAPGDEAGFAANETIDLSRRRHLLMPGLVNAHTHAAMTLFRGLADDLPLMEWLTRYIFPVERNLTAEWVFWGTQLACLEMIAGGTTTFCDMYLFVQAAAEAAEQAGLRALVGEVLYDFPSPNYGPPEAGLRYSRDLIARWRGHDRIRIAVEPHAPYTCSPDLLRQCARLAEESEVPLIIHLAETGHEEATIRERHGLSPVRHLERLGLLSSRLIADHAVHLADDEIDLLAARGVAVAHNPESNMKLASGTAPLPALLRAGVRVGIGTDGCASNNNLDMFQEMDSAAKLQKVTRLDPTALPATTVVRLATAMGAEALGLGTLTGSLEQGKAADLILVDFDQPHLTPVYDYASHLVYAARGADVTDTMVAGRWLLRDRAFTTLDPERVLDQVRRISRRISELVTPAQNAST